MAQLRVVDLFAGWGGFTEGIEQAGHKVVWAANHWQVAVSAHAINHPAVEHVCQDLHQANFCVLPQYDVLVASPACQGHSSASQPKRRSYHDELRATAWAVILAAEATMPKAIIVENVPYFMRWGPPGRPDGSLYRHWKKSLELLGYTLREYLIDATEHGVPQRRKRLFIVATRDDVPFDYVPPFPASEYEEPAIGPEMEWGAGRWRPIEQAKPGRLERIMLGIERYGTSRFIGQDVTGHRGISPKEAIRTITTQDQWFAVKRASLYRPLTIRETARAMGFPDWYEWPAEVSRRDCIIGLGNAVCPPVARDLITQLAEVIKPSRRRRRALPAAAKRKPAKKAAKKKAKKKPSKRRAPAEEVDLLELARWARGE